MPEKERRRGLAERWRSLRLRLRPRQVELRQRYPALEAVRLPPRAVVLDGGAYVGDFSECVLAWQPTAQLHVFEPNPAAFAILVKRVAPFAGVTLNQAALGKARSTAAEFRISRCAQASSLLDNGPVLDDGLYGMDFSTESTIRVPVETVAGYVRDRNLTCVDLLKLDVQGSELEVLRGAEPILERVRFIYCEAQFQELYRGAALAPAIFAWLHQRNFELLRMSAFRASDAGELMECDMLFAAR